MIELLKAVLYDLTTKRTWVILRESLTRHIPGDTGFLLRRHFMGGLFLRRGKGLVIYPGATIYGPQRLEVGDDCRIGVNCTLQANGGIQLGDDVTLGPGVKIWSVNHASSRTDVSIWDQGYDHNQVVIGNSVWIGANTFIMPGAKIGDHVIVSAGSVVGGKEVEPYTVLAGNPARRVGRREPTETSTPAPAL